MEKDYHANTKHKKAEDAITISDKTDFNKTKYYQRKEGHCIIIKGSVY